jgi:secreted Zn-dependent insulinase-like peptidase
LEQLTFANAKVILSARNVVNNNQIQLEPLSEILEEKYMKTKFQLFEKPKLSTIDNIAFKLPEKNNLIPSNFEIFSQEKKKENDQPALHQADLYQLWFMQDHVFQMPRVIVNFIFYIPGIINTVYKKAQKSVFIDVLVEKVAQVIGYEATLADVAWNVKVLENHGFKFKFKGYNDKLGYFISQLFAIVKDLGTNGLKESESFLVDNAIEKMTKEYKN